MKKIIIFVMSALMVLGLPACGSQDGGNRTSASQTTNEGNGTESLQNQREEVGESSVATPAEESGDSPEGASKGDAEITEGKTLVVYYSATGYTESVATYIAEARRRTVQAGAGR